MSVASVHRFSATTERKCPRRQSRQRKPAVEVFAIAKSACIPNVIDRKSCKTTDREPLCVPLSLGPKLELWPPVLAAPMAGISCAPYRKLCTSNGAQLATSEMVIASSFLLSNRRTAKLASFAPDEPIRSVQIYGVRPEQVREVSNSHAPATRGGHGGSERARVGTGRAGVARGRGGGAHGRQGARVAALAQLADSGMHASAPRGNVSPHPALPCLTLYGRLYGGWCTTTA